MRLGAQAPRLAVGLTRVSTAEQGNSGLGLEAQQASIRGFVAAQGWTLVGEYSDIASGKDDRRPGFQAALARCRQLDAVLVAARLDRITRRAHTLSLLLEDGVSIRAADMPGADDLMLRIYAAMAQKERELISERTRAALAAAKARWRVLGGDHGYPPTCRPRRRRSDAGTPGCRRLGGASARAGTGAAERGGRGRPCRDSPRADRPQHPHPARRRGLDPHHRGAGHGARGALTCRDALASLAHC